MTDIPQANLNHTSLGTSYGFDANLYDASLGADFSFAQPPLDQDFNLFSYDTTLDFDAF
jgi:hypothetical protein